MGGTNNTLQDTFNRLRNNMCNIIFSLPQVPHSHHSCCGNSTDCATLDVQTGGGGAQHYKRPAPSLLIQLTWLQVQHKDDLNMKTQLGLLCFAVVTSLAKAELGAPQLPAHITEKIRFPLNNYRPLLDQLNIETVSFYRRLYTYCLNSTT